MSPMDLAIKRCPAERRRLRGRSRRLGQGSNISHFATLSNINLSVGATTVIAAIRGMRAELRTSRPFPVQSAPAAGGPQRVLGWLENLPLARLVADSITKMFVDTGLPPARLREAGRRARFRRPGAITTQ